MGDLRQDLTFAIRSLRREPAFAAVVLTILALGIGSAIAMFSLVNGVLLRPPRFEDPDRLAIVTLQSMRGEEFPLPDADFLQWRTSHRAFERVAIFSETSFSLTGSGTPEVIRGAFVSGEFFATLRLQAALGRTIQADDDRPGSPSLVVLTQAFWARRFNSNPAVVGTTVRLNDQPCTIVGVVAGSSFPGPDLDLWRNLTIGPVARRGPFYSTGLARLARDASWATARQDMQSLRRDVLRRYGGPSDWSFRVVSLTDSLVGDMRTPFYLLLASVGFLLLIAVANVANLLLARAAGRQRELAVRAALGAGSGRLVRQLLVEALLLGAGGGLLGVLLSAGAIKLLQRLAAGQLPRLDEVHMDARVLAFAVLTSLTAALMFGAGPALLASRRDVVESIRAGARASAGRSSARAQRALVVVEVALALMLSVGAALFVGSLVRLQQASSGFDPSGLVTFSINLPDTRYRDEDASRQFFQRLLARIRAVPGVADAAVAVSLPPHLIYVTDYFTVEGTSTAPGATPPVAPMVVSSPSVFRTLRIPLIEGRTFTDSDRHGAERVVVVSRSLARWYYPNGQAIGRLFRTGGPERPNNPWMRVVGVVGDVKYDGLNAEAGPAFYVPLDQDPWTTQYVVVRTSLEPESIVGSLRSAVWSIDREIPLARVRTMDQILREASSRPRFRTFVLSAFGSVGLVLAFAGVYGLMSYVVTRRMHEMGVRTALGAQRRDLVGLVLKDALRLAILGVAFGLAGAVALTRVSSTLLFGVSATDPLTFGATALLVLAAMLVASWLPALRAARVNPTTALIADV